MSAPPALLHALVDYAGLFPPAQLPMRQALQNYASYLAGPHRSLLGRFVVPLARLEELAAEYHELSPAERARDWELSVLTGPDSAADRTVLESFARAHPQFRIASVETKAATAEAVHAATQAFPRDLEVWVELSPEQPQLTASLAAIREAGRGAKLRTGGVTPEAFPTAARVTGFLRACLNAGVPCKATAGLHHARRGDYRLTYEPESPHAVMHGFVNVFVAATLLHAGGSDAEAIALLEDRSAESFRADADSVSWREHRFTEDQLAAARQSLCRSFGSCSFTEPIEGLQELHWL